MINPYYTQRILVVNVNWLGDVLMSAPVFWNLKKKFPKAWVVCLAPPRVKDIFSCFPFVDEVIVYDEDGEHKSVFGKLKLIFKLRSYGFSKAFLLHKSLTRALLVFLAGIPVRVGYDTKNRGFLLTHKYPLPSEIKHRLDEYQNLIKQFDVPLELSEVILRIPPDLASKTKKKLEDLGFANEDLKILIHPAANWNLKRWPKENFTSLIDRLMQDKAKVIVTGSKDEESLVQDIIKPLKVKPIVLVGQTSLSELAALMSKVNVVISADSGPMHLGSAACANVIALFGPTRSQVTGPRGFARHIILQHEVGCNKNPCYHLTCPDNICMQSITVEDVLDAVRQIKN